MSNGKKHSIGVILPEVERWSNHYGGALGRFMFEVLDHAPHSNYTFEVYCKSCRTEHAYPHPVNEPKLGNFTLWLDRTLTKIRTGFAGWAYVVSFYPKIKQHDLIHVFNRPFYALILRRLGYKGKIIIHLQNDFHKSSPEYAKAFIKSADLVISCSQKISDRLFEKDPENNSKSHVIYNGANAEQFAYKPIENRKKQLLYVGRIDEIKGIHNLIDAFAEIQKTHPEWKLVLAGSAGFGEKSKLTAYERKIQEKISKLKADGGKVEHIGYVDHEKLPALFQESQLFCLPSVVHEAFGMVIVEAAFCGTPVVCSNLGGIPEAVGEYGVLCDPNAKALEEGIRKYLDNPELMKEFGNKGAQRTRKLFSWSRIAKDQFDAYERVLSLKSE